jgi:GDP-L-fucose synthase
VDDLADACLHLLEHYDGPEHVNVGSGTDATIREIADIVASVVGFTGETNWDSTKPDGTPRKLLDVSKLAASGWTSNIGLREGLERTIAWYRNHVGALRGRS